MKSKNKAQLEEIEIGDICTYYGNEVLVVGKARMSLFKKGPKHLFYFLSYENGITTVARKGALTVVQRS